MLRSVLPLGLTFCFAAVVFAQVPSSTDATKIAAIIQKLDAESFTDREAAQKALVEIGEPAEEALKKAVAETKSAEVRQRVAVALRQIDLKLIASKSFQLNEVIALTKASPRVKIDPGRIEAQLARLLELLATDTGVKRRLPVTLDLVSVPGHHNDISRRKLMVVENAALGKITDCIVIASGILDIANAHNCILVAGVAVDVGSAKNSLIIAGEEVWMGTDYNGGDADRSSIVISGGNLHSYMPNRHTVFAAAGHFEQPGSTPAGVLLNTNIQGVFGVEARSAGLRVTRNDRIRLERNASKPPQEVPFKITRAPGEGRFVFRSPGSMMECEGIVGQPLADATGKPLVGLAGWKVQKVHRQLAIIVKDDQQFVLRWQE